MKRISIIALFLILAVNVFFTSCEQDIKPTRMIVLDSIRHYYPIVQGKDLDMVWRIANIGESPLVITDIMPSCGCVCAEEKDGMILPPGKEGALHFKFQSDKYSGYVAHTIRLYGNIYPNRVCVLRFDTNVVPAYHSSPDYEEYFMDNEPVEQKSANYQRRAYEIDKPDSTTFSQQYFFDLDNNK